MAEKSKETAGTLKSPCMERRNLTGKSIVLLGEQGIGDTMMFSSLIPTFKNANQCKLYFMPGTDY